MINVNLNIFLFLNLQRKTWMSEWKFEIFSWAHTNLELVVHKLRNSFLCHTINIPAMCINSFFVVEFFFD